MLLRAISMHMQSCLVRLMLLQTLTRGSVLALLLKRRSFVCWRATVIRAQSMGQRERDDSLLPHGT